jgi:hypothetical protein
MLRTSRVVGALVISLAMVLPVASGAASGSEGSGTSEADRLADYWDEERRASVVPRDLVIDHRGLGYLRRADGGLEPYGHDRPSVVQAAAARSVPQGRPSSQPGQLSAPTVTVLDPLANATIGAAHVFKARVESAAGIRSVTFIIHYPDGRTGRFSASHVGNNVWQVSFSGFSDGQWAWQVEARDKGPKGGLTTTTAASPFAVEAGGGSGGTGGDTGGGSGTTVANAVWPRGGDVQTAIGRILFEMPSRGNRWSAYVCSGTAVKETNSANSVILTAAHCVYDDVNKVFARNVLFIPDQAGTTGTGTDRDCGNDPYGCWAPSHGVVDAHWTTRKWPDNIPWDYAYYVVPASGAHTGTPSYGALENAVRTLSISFDAPATGQFTHALGYSYNQDPKLMYCAENLGTVNGPHNWWLASCGMSGGSSGGPWIQPLVSGSGPIVSVNSWGYSNQPGMAGPKLSGTSASCVFGVAQNAGASPTNRGIIVTCP